MAVYFIQAENGLIKIGYTRELSIEGRLKVLSATSPIPLEFLGSIPDSHGDERIRPDKSYHRRFAHLHHHGEWFTPGPDLMAFIKNLGLDSKTLKKIITLQLELRALVDSLRLFEESLPSEMYQNLVAAEKNLSAALGKVDQH